MLFALLLLGPQRMAPAPRPRLSPYHPLYRRPSISARNLIPAQRQTARSRTTASQQIVRAVQHPLRFPPSQSCPAPDRQTTHSSPPIKPSALSPPKHQRPQSHPSPAPDRERLPPNKSSAHKRPVDRPVGLRVCRCRYRRRPLADVPKERAAIQLPGTKRPFPERRAAWGWLPAAAFHPANPQPEASAGFLVPFSKKGTSYM